jgi:hypothetical protein
MAFALTAGACGGERAASCREGQVATPVRAVASASAGQLIHAHAHNDYEHDRPLLDALDQRFYSVEADVYFDGGKFKVAHSPWDWSKGTLKNLYLDPLQARVDATGSVHGDGERFTLWIDLKDSDPGLPDALRALLDRYSMLSRFSFQGEVEGPVTVVLTGNSAMKRAVVDVPELAAARDSNGYSPDDLSPDGRWKYYALSWGDFLDWNGQGAIPEVDQQRLACILENAHAQGRKVRFWATPDRREAWLAQLNTGVDFINTDRLAELSATLAGEP